MARHTADGITASRSGLVVTAVGCGDSRSNTGDNNMTTDSDNIEVRVVFSGDFDTSEVSPIDMRDTMDKCFQHHTPVSMEDSYRDAGQLTTVEYTVDTVVTVEELSKCRDMLRLTTEAYKLTLVVA